jgi:hypothetical protein
MWDHHFVTPIYGSLSIEPTPLSLGDRLPEYLLSMAYMGVTVTIWDSWSENVDKLSPSLLFFFNMDTISDWLNFILPFVVVFSDFLRYCLGDRMLVFLKFTVERMD